jgi:hypothetical protein
VELYTPKGRILLEHVDELIDPHTREWDEQLVREIFGILMLAIFFQYHLVKMAWRIL